MALGKIGAKKKKNNNREIKVGKVKEEKGRAKEEKKRKTNGV
mgnify:CR=1 FL=1